MEKVKEKCKSMGPYVKRWIVPSVDQVMEELLPGGDDMSQKSSCRQAGDA